MPLVVYLKSHYHTQGHLHSLLSYFQGIYSFYFIVRSMIYFELIFVTGIEFMSRFFFLKKCGCPGVQTPFVEEVTFAPLYCLCFFVKD